jgi:VanZ family protein
MQIILGSAALLLNFIGYIPYIKDIFCKKVKPHRITWGVWTILTTIAAFNQVSNEGGYSSLFFISTAFLVSFVFILSFRYGMGGASRIDRACLILALLLLVYWVTVHETRISTVIAVIIDAIGAIPTLIKTFRNPETETYIQWTLAGIAGFLTMLAVPRFDLILIIYPLYVVLMNGAIVGVKYIKELQPHNKDFSKK